MRRIAVQILLSYLPLVVLTAVIGGYAAALLTDLGGTVGRVLAENYRSVLAAEGMQRALDLEALAHTDAVAFDAAARDFESALAEAYGGVAVPGERAMLDSVATWHESYGRAVRRGDLRLAAPLSGRMRRSAERLRHINQSAILDKNEQAERASAAARRSLTAAVVLAVVLSLGAGAHFARRIARPIRLLTSGVEDVARGRFERRVDASAGGEVGRLGAAFNEMTHRLRAYEALNVRAILREKRTTEQLIEAIPSPVVVTDAEGRLRLFNHAAAALLVEPEATGALLSQAAPALSAALDAAPPRPNGLRLARLDSAEGPRTYQLRQTHVVVSRDESARGASSAHAEPLDAHDGPLTVTLLDDVTRIQAADQARREFLAAVSHELRTPLTSLGIAVDLLRREFAGPLADEQRDLLGTAKADTDRLKGLVSRLLDLARLDAVGVRRGPVDLGAIAEGAAAGVALAAGARGVAVCVEVAPALPLLDGDAEALGWAASNLAVNAVRHAETRATLSVDLSPTGDALRLAVTDDGPGLPPGSEALVFEPLVQLAPRRAMEPHAEEAPGRAGSAGLGLTIVRRVAEAHGGDAQARPGPGGHFVLTLPLLPS